jgi:hypothetical protein
MLVLQRKGTTMARCQAYRCLVFLMVTFFSLTANAQPNLTVGAFLNKMVDQTSQAMDNATNTGSIVKMQTAISASILISQARNVFVDSSNQMLNKDPEINNVLNQIQEFVNKVTRNEFITADEATKNLQRIEDMLPIKSDEPRVTSVSPNFVAPSSTVYFVPVRVTGNFVDFTNAGYEPVLTVNGSQFTGTASAQDVQFFVPISVLNPSGAAGKTSTSFSSAKMEFMIPWKKPNGLGFLQNRKEDHFELYVGVLPGSIGKITLIQTIPVSNALSKPIDRGQSFVSSDDGKDKINMPVKIVPDAGWEIIPNSCNLNAMAHGDYSISRPSEDAKQCEWSLTTISHGVAGVSGAINYHLTATEEQQVTTSISTASPSFTLDWGASKTLPLSSSDWILEVDSFDGNHSEYNGPENSSKIIAITNAPNNSIQLQAAYPSKLEWP